MANLEAAFFKSGCNNLTDWDTENFPNNTVQVINNILQQEETFVASLGQNLDHQHADAVPSCTYIFPNTSDEFIAIAETIASIGTSTFIGLASRLALSDPLLLHIISSITTVEARHNTALRQLQGRMPSPAPFDTPITATWAHNLILPFVVPGSCALEIPIPTLPRLSANISSADIVNVAWDPLQAPTLAESGKPLFVAWIYQLSPPIYTNLVIDQQTKGTGSTQVPAIFRAPFRSSFHSDHQPAAR
jgi:hypothetical protein